MSGLPVCVPCSAGSRWQGAGLSVLPEDVEDSGAGRSSGAIGGAFENSRLAGAEGGACAVGIGWQAAEKEVQNLL